MLAILAGLLSRLLFSGMSIFWKELRHRGLSAYGILAFSVTASLFWPFIALFLLWQGEGHLSWKYLAFACGGVAAFILYNWAVITLFRYQSLTVAEAFRSIFTTATAFMIDIFLFGTGIDPAMVIGAVIMLGSGVTLQLERKKNVDLAHMPVLSVIAVSAFVGVLSAADISFYKAGLELQDNLLFHMAWVNLMIAPPLLFMGWKNLHQAHLDSHIALKYYLIVGAANLVALLLYTYAVDHLSVTMMSLIRIAGMSLFVFADVKFREFTHHPLTYFCLLGILAGLAIITFN